MKITGHVGAEEFFFSESTKRLSNITNILELACGTGITTRLLMNIFPKAHIIGTDISNKMLEIAKLKINDEAKVSFKKINIDNKNHWIGDKDKYNLVVISYGICWFDFYYDFEIIFPKLQKDGYFLIIDDIDLSIPLFSNSFPEVAEKIKKTRIIKKKEEVEHFFIKKGLRKVNEMIYKVGDTHTSYLICYQK